MIIPMFVQTNCITFSEIQDNILLFVSDMSQAIDHAQQ